jgi:NADPH:quinone reductase-like Zn-dependent oxidoreductase
MVGGEGAQLTEVMLLGPWISAFSRKRIVNLAAKSNPGDLSYISGLIEAGKIMPVVDRYYPLRKTPDALRYYGERHAKGKVVITMKSDDN